MRQLSFSQEATVPQESMFGHTYIIQNLQYLIVRPADQHNAVLLIAIIPSIS